MILMLTAVDPEPEVGSTVNAPDTSFSLNWNFELVPCKNNDI